MSLGLFLQKVHEGQELMQKRRPSYRVYWINERGQAEEHFCQERKIADLAIHDLEKQGVDCGLEVIKPQES